VKDVLFDIYDSAGGVVVGDTPTIVNFDSSRYIDSHSSLDSGEISVTPPTSRIMPPDYYVLLMMCKVTLAVSSGSSRTQTKAWIEYDNGGGFVPIPGIEGYMYNRTLDAGWGTVNLNTTFQKHKRDVDRTTFRVMVQRVSGSSTIITQANASNILCLIHY